MDQAESNNVEDETYSVIFASLKHPVRRKILRMLAEKPLLFSEIKESVAIDSGHLNYHLENLSDLIIHLNDGKYGLSSIGKAAVKLMSGVEEHQPQTVHKRLTARKIISTVYPLLLVVALVIASLFVLNYSVQATGFSAPDSNSVQSRSSNIFIGGANQTVNFILTTERSPVNGAYNVNVNMEAFSMTSYSNPDFGSLTTPVNVGFYPLVTKLAVPQVDIQRIYIGLNITSQMTGFYSNGFLNGSNHIITGVGPSLPLTVQGPNGETSNWAPQWKIGDKETEYYVPTSIDVSAPGNYQFNISYGAGGIVGWNGYMTLNASWQYIEKPYFYYGIAGLIFALGYIVFAVVDRVYIKKRLFQPC